MHQIGTRGLVLDGSPTISPETMLYKVSGGDLAIAPYHETLAFALV